MAKKSVEERVAILDEKIAKKRAELNALEEKRERLLHPVSMRTVLQMAKSAGMTPLEVAERLGLEV